MHADGTPALPSSHHRGWVAHMDKIVTTAAMAVLPWVLATAPAEADSGWFDLAS